MSKQRGAVRAAARAVVSVLRALPQVKGQHYVLLFVLRLRLLQLIPANTNRNANEHTHARTHAQINTDGKQSVRVYSHKDVISVQDAAQRFLSCVDFIEAMVKDIGDHHLYTRTYSILVNTLINMPGLLHDRGF